MLRRVPGDEVWLRRRLEEWAGQYVESGSVVSGLVCLALLDVAIQTEITVDRYALECCVFGIPRRAGIILASRVGDEGESALWSVVESPCGDDRDRGWLAAFQFLARRDPCRLALATSWCMEPAAVVIAVGKDRQPQWRVPMDISEGPHIAARKISPPEGFPAIHRYENVHYDTLSRRIAFTRIVGEDYTWVADAASFGEGGREAVRDWLRSSFPECPPPPLDFWLTIPLHSEQQFMTDANTFFRRVVDEYNVWWRSLRSLCRRGSVVAHEHRPVVNRFLVDARSADCATWYRGLPQIRMAAHVHPYALR